MSFKKALFLSFSALILGACQQTCDKLTNPKEMQKEEHVEAKKEFLDAPSPSLPTDYEQVPHSNPLPVLSLAVQPYLTGANPTNKAPTVDGSNYVGLMMQNGSLLTVWALGLRNWLWGYPPATTKYFGNIRNWTIQRSRTREHFSFRNQQLGTCIEAYGNGLIHNTCSRTSTAQEFELLPTKSGAVVIRNLAQQRCVTYNPVSSTDYTTITMANCTGESTGLKDQVWYLVPPQLDAVTEN